MASFCSLVTVAPVTASMPLGTAFWIRSAIAVSETPGEALTRTTLILDVLCKMRSWAPAS